MMRKTYTPTSTIPHKQAKSSFWEHPATINASFFSGAPPIMDKNTYGDVTFTYKILATTWKTQAQDPLYLFSCMENFVNTQLQELDVSLEHKRRYRNFWKIWLLSGCAPRSSCFFFIYILGNGDIEFQICIPNLTNLPDLIPRKAKHADDIIEATQRKIKESADIITRKAKIEFGQKIESKYIQYGRNIFGCPEQIRTVVNSRKNPIHKEDDFKVYVVQYRKSKTEKRFIFFDGAFDVKENAWYNHANRYWGGRATFEDELKKFLKNFNPLLFWKGLQHMISFVQDHVRGVGEERVYEFPCHFGPPGGNEADELHLLQLCEIQHVRGVSYDEELQSALLDSFTKNQENQEDEENLEDDEADLKVTRQVEDD